MVKLAKALEELNCSELEKITLFRQDNVIFNGSIMQLKGRQDLLNCNLLGNLRFMDKQGLVGNLK